MKESVFINYLSKLKKWSEEFTVIIAFRGGIGNYMNAQHAELIQHLGLSENLECQKMSNIQAYVGIVHKSKAVCESISTNLEKVSIQKQLDDNFFDVSSSVYNDNNSVRIRINELEYALNCRGMNIVIYDTAEKRLVDSVTFNTHIPSIAMLTHTQRLTQAISSINALHASGYSLTKYLLDSGHKRIIIYSEESYFSLIEPICLSFRMEDNISAIFVANEKFSRDYAYASLIGGLEFEKIDAVNITENDTVLVVTPTVQNRNWKEIFNGANILHFEKVLFEMMQYTFFYRGVLWFAKQNPKVRVIIYTPPRARHIKQPSDREKALLKKDPQVHFRKQLQMGTIPECFQGFEYEIPDILELINQPPSVINEHNCKEYLDKQSRFINCADGRRVTTGQPAEYQSTIFCLGNCVTFGHGAPDDSTVASVLQDQINTYTDEKIKVENYGTFNTAIKDKTLNTFFYLPVKDNDIVIYSAPIHSSLCPEYVEYLDMTHILDRPHEHGEIFIDAIHMNQVGQSEIGKHMFQYLFATEHTSKHKDYEQRTFATPIFGIPEWAMTNHTNEQNNLYSSYRAELDEYKSQLKAISLNIGGIVMNCNPFTLGHRYLIESSANKCAHLYIFVVEEDKSVFPFDDRIELVKRGIADLSNVTVLPSGKFIISQLTFTDYFNKSKLQDKAIDPSFDIELFSREIAPSLGITVRFAGEEPLDKVTNQYNETMNRILPQHGIKFEVIPRKESGNEVISASRVRKLLKEKNFDAIAKIVPPSTLKYLKERFSK